MQFDNKIDYDLEACLTHNPQIFTSEDITAVLASWDNGKYTDEPNYIWVIRLTDARLYALTGWHDYTGWDCQSGASAYLIASPYDFANHIDSDIFTVNCDSIYTSAERAIAMFKSMCDQLEKGRANPTTMQKLAETLKLDGVKMLDPKDFS